MIITRTKEDNGFAPVSVRCERRPSNSFRRRGEKATARNRIETAQVSAMRAYCERHEGAWDKKLFGAALSSRDRARDSIEMKKRKCATRHFGSHVVCDGRRVRAADNTRAVGESFWRGGRKNLRPVKAAYGGMRPGRYVDGGARQSASGARQTLRRLGLKTHALLVFSPPSALPDFINPANRMPRALRVCRSSRQFCYDRV
jgi:hypothetical protein